MTALRSVQVACLLSASVALPACSSKSAESSRASASTPASPSLGAPLRLSITVLGVPAGKEGTQCIRAHLGNDAPVRVGKIHNKLSESSHHFILSAVDDTSLTDTPLFDCPPFRAALTGAPLTITQKSDDTVSMPDGVAYTLADNQLMHLELHYINLTNKTEDITAETEIFPITNSAKDLQEASFLLVGDLDISIPPKSTHSTGAVYQKLPQAFEGVNFYALTGHTHRFGTNVQVGVTASETATVTPLYAPKQFNWSEPEVVRLSPTVTVPSGGGFSYQCEWDNPTDKVVKYGESALTEMCFFWAYYYPKQDASRLLLKGVSSAYGDAGAALSGPPCAAAGDTGNALGVGKYCTKGGSECGGSASVCLADYTSGTFGDFCTKTCKTDTDCGAGASCFGQTTAVCMPTSCVASLGTASSGADAAAP
jgi:hypothetical protein